MNANNDNDSDDDSPVLSAEAAQALQEFLASQNSSAGSQFHVSNESEDLMKVNDLTEDWQLSQFWYDDATAERLTEEILDELPQSGRIALIGCPSLYYFVKKGASDSTTVKLLDIDKRFTRYKDDFLQYDYKLPLPPHVPESWENSFDMVVLDPPFLSEECLTKCALTANFLSRDKIIVCTGAVMENLVGKLLKARRTSFAPGHKNNLGNEFACYVNYQSRRFTVAESCCLSAKTHSL